VYTAASLTARLLWPAVRCEGRKRHFIRWTHPIDCTLCRLFQVLCAATEFCYQCRHVVQLASVEDAAFAPSIAMTIPNNV